MDPVEYVFNRELKDAIHEVLKTLTPREEQCIIMHFGLDGDSPASLRTIGARFGLISAERPRQIIAKGLRKLRHPSRSRLLMPFLEDEAYYVDLLWKRNCL